MGFRRSVYRSGLVRPVGRAFFLCTAVASATLSAQQPSQQLGTLEHVESVVNRSSHAPPVEPPIRIAEATTLAEREANFDEDTCDGKYTATNQILDCINGALEKADRSLNEVYSQIKREFAAVANNGSPLLSKDNENDLVRAERAWVAFKDAHCLVAGELLAPGTGMAIETRQCLLRLTRERTKFLNSYFSQLGHQSNHCGPSKTKCARDVD